MTTPNSSDKVAGKRFRPTPSWSGSKASQIGALPDSNGEANLPKRRGLGAVTETVEVAGVAVQLNTMTSTLSEVVEGARIIELPLNGSEVGGARARHFDHLSERGER